MFVDIIHSLLWMDHRNSCITVDRQYYTSWENTF